MKIIDLTWLLTGVALNAGAQLGLKAATGRTGSIDGTVDSMWIAGQKLATTPAFWAALIAYGASLVVWIVGLSRVPVSQAYPVLSIGYVLAALLAWGLLGEAVSLERWAGIFVIIIGVWLVARSA